MIDSVRTIFNVFPDFNFLELPCNLFECILLFIYPFWESLTFWHLYTCSFYYIWETLNCHLFKWDCVSYLCSSTPGEMVTFVLHIYALPHIANALLCNLSSIISLWLWIFLLVILFINCASTTSNPLLNSIYLHITCHSNFLFEFWISRC